MADEGGIQIDHAAFYTRLNRLRQCWRVGGSDYIDAVQCNTCAWMLI